MMAFKEAEKCVYLISINTILIQIFLKIIKLRENIEQEVAKEVEKRQLH
jgi:hypothetical protein